jgi:ADP-heptose:LPS heptosyltransferase
MWKDELMQKDLRSITPSTLRKFGLKAQDVKLVENLEELREAPPNIVIAQSRKNFNFMQNYFKEQSLKKKGKYVMGLGVFQQLQQDKSGQNKLLQPAPMRFKNMYKPYIGQEVDNKTVLIFRTGGIGDLLFIQPNLTYLKQKYPTCYIKFACGPQYQPMVENWDCVDEVLDLPFSFKHLQESDYHMLFEGVIERCKEAETKNAYNLFSTWLGLDLPDNLLLPKQEPKEELVDECFEILKEWALENDSFVLMQLRASSPIRTPRHEFWSKIIDELNRRGHNVILTDNPRQSENIDNFIKLLKKPEMTFNFCQHSESIAYTIALTSLCKITFGTDSALGHIAASLNKKCFGIYGPFPGYIRLKTYPKATWIDAKRDCAPCFIHSQKACPQSKDIYSPCYDELIETDEKLKDVIDKFEEFLNG